METVIAKKEGRRFIKVPVSYEVCGFITVQADSVEEAVEYCENHIDELPLAEEPEYVDGSYELTTTDPDEIGAYLRGTGFSCVENLGDYTTSMLFDSGTVIATGDYDYLGKHMTIDLQVCGEASVTYKGETYHKPSEFPDELVELIKAHPDDFDTYAPSGEDNDDAEGDVYVTLNNWFEYIWHFDGSSDGILEEGNIAKMTSGDIHVEMDQIAQHVILGTEL